MSAADNIIEVRDVTMRFGGLTAVSQLDIRIPRGGIVGLIGPNGAGKTTVFNVITGFYTPQEGKVFFEGRDITGVKPHRICAAGMAAHLAGAVAARTLKPVIGIPVSGAALGGMDALLSTVQMPPGFPVATVALDKGGARNAAWLAAQILALTDPGLAAALAVEREAFKVSVDKAGREIEAKYA